MTSTLHIGGLALEPDWVEAWGTWFSGLISAGALYYVGRSFNHERRLRREADAERDAERRRAQEAQAGTVAIFGRKTRRLDGTSGIMCFEVQVANYGSAAVTDVVGRLTYLSTGAEIGTELGDFSSAAALSAGEVKRFEWRFPVPAGVTPTSADGLFRPEVSFLDIHGTRCSRSYGKDQRLHRVP